ncbi:SusC/RagA family TonB-linked outer membrane protein [Pedobacter gandavensis]|uniref:SusC/RagA family TonB-linked outer membrane protein n=1 Tax=Pedobacter gandavensis TaxID=2679963 RepID=A0ABR6EX65_9SPHI|nr:TonB-dependent receptor [Pedobacter gandavensis]MBB2149868.1 SusC/RagA family TonB-linked outer membrane protein [Pedobacter gandavensis]
MKKHQLFKTTGIWVLMAVMLLFVQDATAVVKPRAQNNNVRTNLADIVVKGTVKDGQGPLPGVTVTLKSAPGRGTSTDANGNFSISVPENGVLVFKMLSYAPQEIPVNNQKQINVTLVPESNDLDEVVVVAYGTQKKASLTGAVASISPKTLANRPVTSVQNALQGVTPGLTVLQRPGDVGRASDGTSGGTGTISIRGRSSLSSGNGPMYIIDGIPATAQEFATINPLDIASMSVLKDASSAALYGSRAANGVIVLTTKRGSGDKTSIQFNANYGWQTAAFLPEFAGSAEYATLLNEAKTNFGAKPVYTAEQIELFKNGSQPDYYPNTDWYKEALRKSAPQSDLSLNINSPGKITSTYLSVNYLGQESLIPNKKQDRMVAKLNTDSKVIADLLTIGTNVSFINQNYSRKGGPLSFVELSRALPVTVSRQSNGAWGSISGGVPNENIAGNNQLRNVAEGGRSWDKDNYLQTAVNASLTPLKGLSINGLASLKYFNSNSWEFISRKNPINNYITGLSMTSTEVKVNEMKEYWRKRQEVLLQGTVDYQRTFGDHFGKMTVGTSQESNITRDAFLGRKNFPNNDMTTVGSGSTNPEDMSSDDTGQANRSLQSEWALRSFFGRFNYAYKDKYLFEANARIDYSSRFRKDLRRGIFPSFSAGWNVAKEDFLKDATWISNLKLRGSYGSLGNQGSVPIGNYYGLLETGYAYNFEDSPQTGVYQNAIPDPNTTWEEVYMTDFGIDATFFGGKLDLVTDVYIKDTENLLVKIPRLATIGIDLGKLPLSNGASTRNKGFEIGLTYNDQIGDDFKFSIGGNFSVIKNKITSLGTGADAFDGMWIQRVGQSIGSYYGYVAEGLFVDEADVKNHAFQTADTKPGDIKYKDLNGNGVKDAGDRTIIGNDVPWLNYGFNFSATYKSFDLSVLTYGVGNVQTYFSGEAAYPFYNGAGVKTAWRDRWTPENPDPNAAFPRILETSAGKHNYNETSSFWLFDASYFRIRAITLGYTFDKELIKKVGMSNLRIYGSANNPFTFMADKRLKDFDPEMASGRAGYPGIKTWSIGLSAAF